MRAKPLVLLLTVFFTLGRGEPALALEATPAGSGQSVSCQEIEPRNPAAIEDLQGTTEAEGSDEAATPASPTPVAMPKGEPADDAMIVEVERLYEQLAACLNAGDYLRAYALYTDDYLRQNLSEEALSDLEATPSPADESTQSQFGGVLEAVMLDNGRIAALVTVSNPQSGKVIIHSILVRDGDRLRIDEEVVVEAESPESSGDQSRGRPAA